MRSPAPPWSLKVTALLDPVALLVDDLLGSLEEVGHPADLALGERDLEVRVLAGTIPTKSQESIAPEVRIAPQVRLAMKGESGAICGTCEDDPTWMLMTSSRSLAALMTGSQ